jgi:nitronate monooxygenase
MGRHSSAARSAAGAAYRAALASPAAFDTQFTTLISGRPARALANRFTALADTLGGCLPPAYPIAYDAGKALNAAAKAAGEHRFGAMERDKAPPLPAPCPQPDCRRTGPKLA